MTAARAILVLAVLAGAGLAAYFLLRPLPDGEAVFKKQGCVRCHHIHGVGEGPVSLNGVTKRRSDTWIRQQIEDARIHNSTSGMPSFGYLPRAKIKALVRFLHKQGQQSAAHSPSP
ncbi:MAG: c-type cytochrome [Nitrospirota bacterium]